MQPAKVIQDEQLIRDRIMAAALARFRHYGYNKTTMAEIAADCDMSTANIYRYFANKQEIASICVANCIKDRIRQVEEIASDQTLNAQKRLRAFVLTLLQNCHDTYSQDVKIHELVLFITNEHPDIIHDKIKKLQTLIAEILAHGNDTGEFEIKDIPTTARSIYSSIAVFDIPLFMNFYTLEEFQQRANEVVDLILDGLLKREHANHFQERSPL